MGSSFCAQRQCFLVEALVILSDAVEDCRVSWLVGLNDHFGGSLVATDAPDNLCQQLERSLAGRKIGQRQATVGLDHPNGAQMGRSRPLATTCVPMAMSISPEYSCSYRLLTVWSDVLSESNRAIRALGKSFLSSASISLVPMPL